MTLHTGIAEGTYNMYPIMMCGKTTLHVEKARTKYLLACKAEYQQPWMISQLTQLEYHSAPDTFSSKTKKQALAQAGLLTWEGVL